MTYKEFLPCADRLRELCPPEEGSEYWNHDPNHFYYDMRESSGRFWIKLMSPGILKIAIRSHSTGRWCADTDFIAYRVTLYNLHKIIDWVEDRRANGDFWTGWGQQLEYPRTMTYKDQSQGRFRRYGRVR